MTTVELAVNNRILEKSLDFKLLKFGTIMELLKLPKMPNKLCAHYNLIIFCLINSWSFHPEITEKVLKNRSLLSLNLNNVD